MGFDCFSLENVYLWASFLMDTSRNRIKFKPKNK